MTCLLDVSGLTAGYNGVTVVSDISLHVDAGETVAVIGANGAGKTTLIRCIAGMVNASSGRVTFNGKDITGLSSDRTCEAGLAQSPEGRQLFATMSVEDNLRLGAILRRAHMHTEDNLARVFDLFPVLKSRRRQISGTLSGGEQQMVAIGRALMSDPLLIMLDEPSLGLAPVMVDVMFDTIANLNKNGMSILLVEQNTAESLALSSRAYVMENGQIVLQGAGSELLNDDRVRHAYLGI
jgi:branched-chain amino acid transport system ATP-binding protein